MITSNIQFRPIFVIFIISIGKSISEDQTVLNKCPDYQGISDLTWQVPPNLRTKDYKKSAFNLSLSSEPLNLACKSLELIQTSDKKSFDPTGTVYISSGRKDIFERHEFCVSELSKNDQIALKVCKVECGVTHNCLKKCCIPSKMFGDAGKCIAKMSQRDEERKDRQKFYNFTNDGCLEHTAHLPLHIFWGKPTIRNGTTLSHVPGRNFRLISNGSLVESQRNGWKLAAHQEYCVEYGNDSQMITLTLFNQSAANDESMTNKNNFRLTFLTISFVISIIFLILTIIVYVLIWEKQNIHGWTVFAFVVNLLAFFIILLISHLVTSFVTDEFLSTSSCHFLAYSHHFLYLATTCWMSVINADLWLTFRSLTPPTRSKMLMRFSMYVGFSILLPLFIVLIGVILTHSKELFTTEDEDCGTTSVTISVPGYGIDRCTVHKDGEIAYVYVPIGILLFANIAMFCSTVFNLWKYKETTKNAVSNSTSCTQRQSLFLFLKLFFVMGISWVFELISRICTPLNESDYWYWWVPADLLNFAQAVSVFFIFAAKRENILFIARKYPSTRHVLYRVLRWRLCRVDAVDIEQTEMTTTERGATFKGRFSSFALTRKLSSVSTYSNDNRRKFSTASVDDKAEAKQSEDQTKV